LNQSSDNIKWEEVLLRLTAFTDSLVSRLTWFRGKKVESFLKGKQVEDYVQEAILRYLNNPEKYDSAKGTLVDYLCLNIIRSLVSNDVNSSENKTTKLLSSFQVLSRDGVTLTYEDALLPHVEALFDEAIDHNALLSKIETNVKGDVVVENIFLGICLGNKRREVIKEFGMSEKEFDNGMRRLKTILSNSAQEIGLQN
jgi:DNA-directed RNA polymerase specialized sigma24 family protein